jgi:hypothetical protein
MNMLTKILTLTWELTRIISNQILQSLENSTEVKGVGSVVVKVIYHPFASIGSINFILAIKKCP